MRVYTTKDGLLGNQFNYKSALKGEDGKFYFGGIEKDHIIYTKDDVRYRVEADIKVDKDDNR